MCSHICDKKRVFFTSCASDHSRMDPFDEQQMMLQRENESRTGTQTGQRHQEYPECQFLRNRNTFCFLIFIAMAICSFYQQTWDSLYVEYTVSEPTPSAFTWIFQNICFKIVEKTSFRFSFTIYQMPTSIKTEEPEETTGNCGETVISS